MTEVLAVVIPLIDEAFPSSGFVIELIDLSVLLSVLLCPNTKPLLFESSPAFNALSGFTGAPN